MYKIQELLDYLVNQKITYQFKGNPEREIQGFSGLNRYKLETMTWIKDIQKAAESGLLSQEITLAVTNHFVQNTNIKNQIIAENSKQVFFSLIERMAETKEEEALIGPNTVIGKHVVIGKNVRIGANCVIKGEVTIGDHTVIGNNVVIINRVRIGNNCVIQSGAVIGEEGFSYWEENHKKTMIKHYGSVVIENNVRIGTNSCIIRGTIDDTLIGEGSKIDNLCHVGHNCQIGKNCVIIAGATLCGSVVVEDNAYISSSAIRQQLHVGEEALVGLGAVVVKDVLANTVVVGNPARKMK